MFTEKAMTNPADRASRVNFPPYEDLTTAPFIYFDIVPAHGTMAGAVQIELASRVLIPHPGGTVEVNFVSIARLRCSPAAAANLRHAIDSALNALVMLEQPQLSPTAIARLN
jgi:hypothetical protein